MATKMNSDAKRAMLSSVLKELSSTVRSPIYDYAKSNVLYRKTDLICALAGAVQETTQRLAEDPSEASDEDKSEKLLDSGDDDFYRIFRFRRKTIKALIQVLDNRLSSAYDSDGSTISPAKKVLITVWLLTSGEDYNSASNVFDISSKLVLPLFLEVCSELTKLVGRYINWPTEAETQTIMDAFEMQFGFPDVVGVIGSTSFRISRPLQDISANHFYNPASDHHSIVIQAVCDHRLIVHDVCAGFPSRRTPSEILRDSPLYTRLVNRSKPLMPPQTFILGSRLYPQLPNLLTPYSPEGREPLNKSELDFNKLHCAAESLIQKCFDALRNRFLLLKYINVPDPPKATLVVLAACVLHNFALIHGDNVS